MPDYNNDARLTQCIITQKQLESIEAVLEEELVEIGVPTVLLVDMAGNIIAKHDRGDCSSSELWSLAVLASANCITMDVMARNLGEREFSLHLLKGVCKTAYFAKVDSQFLLITVFGRDVPLGRLRMKVREVVGKVRDISEAMQNMLLRPRFSLIFAGETG